MPHDYIAPLLRLAPPHRALVYYDPTGSGRSDRPAAPGYDLDLFVDEVAALRAELGLARLHLCGPSFGGLVCLAYALRRPEGVCSATLSGTSASYPETRAAVRRRILTLPAATRDPLLAAVDGGHRGPVYARAYQEYAGQFLCRIPHPPALTAAVQRANVEAMNGMRGRGVVYDGTLRDVDLRARLGEIDTPVLLIYGRRDPLYPEVADGLARALRRSRTVVFHESSHTPELEEPELFARTLYGFVDEIDAA
jgi:proline-specific peptidase